MITTRINDNCLLVDFDKYYEDWDAFEVIAAKLNDFLGAKVIYKADGPESRVWLININGEQISLHNNPYGNYLKAESAQSQIVLQNMLPKLNELF